MTHADANGNAGTMANGVVAAPPLSDEFEPFERQVAGHKLTWHDRVPAPPDTHRQYKVKSTVAVGVDDNVTSLGECALSGDNR